ncbi:MAG: hypothetical protein A2Z07_05210 [Armatimonadetes bacterium RBG_16_67_12]|nr:MAG: hypothetical protein A2Z07_05210 [Armatimonadetes bacterium RBG_16_67_12]
MTIDPVCEMEVDEATAAPTSVYQGQTYYFCAPGCKVAFDEDPQRYLHKTAAADRPRRRRASPSRCLWMSPSGAGAASRG